MYSFVKRNILIGLIGVFPMVVGVESATGHGGGGSSAGQGGGSSAGHGGESGGGHGGAGHGNSNSWSAPTGAHSSTAAPTGAHSSTAATSAHMSSSHFAASAPHATGDNKSGKFVHTGPAKTGKQRQFASGFVPNSSVENDDWRKRHHYRHSSSP